MNRSVKSLLSVSVLVPATALAVAAAPANAAPGPSTTLLYESYAAAAPAARALPANVTTAAGQTAELATHTVDGVLESAPARSGARAARCSLDPAETINGKAGTNLPGTPLTTDRKSPLSMLPEDACLGVERLADRRAEGAARPMPLGGVGSGGGLGDVPVVGGLVGGVLGNTGGLGLRSARSGLPGGRHAGSPLSMDLSDVPGTLGAASPAGLPVGTTLFPPTGRTSRPGPNGDVVDQASGLVGEAGAELDESVIGGTGLGRSQGGVGKVVKVLKAGERAANPADNPVSLLDSSGLGSSGLGLPGVPALG